MGRTGSWLAGLVFVVGVSTAAGEWLPAEVEAGAAGDLAGRMKASARGPVDEPEIRTTARRAISAMRKVIDSWGEDGLLRRAPEFPALELPSPGQKHLGAMLRYHVCTLVLALQNDDPAFADDRNARVTAVFGLSALPLAIVRLREPLLAAGKKESDIESTLTSGAVASLFERLQTDAATRAHVEERCTPVVVAFLEEPLKQLGSP